MTVQINRAQAQALLKMFNQPGRANNNVELENWTHGELFAEWQNEPETRVELPYGVVEARHQVFRADTPMEPGEHG